MTRPSDARWSVQVVSLPPRMVRRAVTVAACLAGALAGAAVLARAGLGWPLAACASAAGAAALAGAPRLRRGRRRPASASVRALRAGSGGLWWVRRGGGWRPARLLDSRRGPGWLALALSETAGSADAPHARPLRATVWRCAAGADAWRRLRVLAAVPPRPAGRRQP